MQVQTMLLTVLSCAILIGAIQSFYTKMIKPKQEFKTSNYYTDNYSNDYDKILLGIHKSVTPKHIQYYEAMIERFYLKYKNRRRVGQVELRKDVVVLFTQCEAQHAEIIHKQNFRLALN